MKTMQKAQNSEFHSKYDNNKEISSHYVPSAKPRTRLVSLIRSYDLTTWDADTTHNTYIIEVMKDQIKSWQDEDLFLITFNFNGTWNSHFPAQHHKFAIRTKVWLRDWAEYPSCLTLSIHFSISSLPFLLQLHFLVTHAQSHKWK